MSISEFLFHVTSYLLSGYDDDIYLDHLFGTFPLAMNACIDLKSCGVHDAAVSRLFFPFLLSFLVLSSVNLR